MLRRALEPLDLDIPPFMWERSYMRQARERKPKLNRLTIDANVDAHRPGRSLEDGSSRAAPSAEAEIEAEIKVP